MEKIATNKPTLSRKLGLLSLAATGICSMLGASVYIVPIMIQRNVPGIGPYVLPAFLLACEFGISDASRRGELYFR